MPEKRTKGFLFEKIQKMATSGSAFPFGLGRGKEQRHFFVCLLFLLAANFIYAQPKINSPYSIIGIGDLHSQSYAALNGFGNLAAAYNDFAHTNFRNPASLSFLKTTAFEVGVNARYGKLELDDEQAKVWSGNLSYMSLAFPVRNIGSRVLDRDKSPVYWGMGINLQPYSNVGYDVSTIGTQTNIDTIVFSYQGTGGTYQLLWSNGAHYKWSNSGDTTNHRLAAGLSLGYLFGSISNDQIVDFANLEYHYLNIIENQSSVRGFLWNFGLQYDYTFLNKSKSLRELDRSRLTVGLYGHSGNNMRIKTEREISRINLAYNNRDTIRIDTAALSHKGRLPAELGVGLIYRFRKSKAVWKIGTDFSFANWSNYYNEANDEKKGDLENAYEFAVGAECIPNAYGLNNYLGKVRYRFGGFYGRDPRGGANVGINESLTHYGITLGLGLPIILKNETSFINLALELGSLNGENSIKDTYGKLTVGFTFNDNNWFYKRKFN